MSKRFPHRPLRAILLLAVTLAGLTAVAPLTLAGGPFGFQDAGQPAVAVPADASTATAPGVALDERGTANAAATADAAVADQSGVEHLPLGTWSSPAQPPVADLTAIAAANDAAASTVQQSASGSTATTTSKTSTAAPTYSGTNHVWLPSLGISRHVYVFPCSRSTDPANLVYRWGCAGKNNVYLLGHAWGVFKPLHDAYYNGKLKVGMKVIYADASGRVRTYKVTEWRVVKPEDAAWAIADQPVPSMTLQTCIGSNGQYRLNVRLVAVN
jgi:Sortase domain